MLALSVGLFLIFAVIVVTFLRSYWSNRPINDGNNAENASQNSLKNLRIFSPPQLALAIKNAESLEIIDIRLEDEFYKEHILDSQNIPFSVMENRLGDLDKNKQYVLVGSNQRDEEVLAAALLIPGGFSNIILLEGGFTNWKGQYNATISSGDPLSFVDQSKVKYVKSDELKKRMSTESNLYIIDLRKKDSFEKGHLPNAVNIYLEDLEKRRKEIPAGKKIILYDNDGLWAFQGAVRLFDMGVLNVEALSDGLKTWQEKGFEVVK